MPISLKLLLLFSGALPLIALLDARFFGASFGTIICFTLVLLTISDFKSSPFKIEFKSNFFISIILFFALIIFQLSFNDFEAKIAVHYIMILIVFISANRVFIKNSHDFLNKFFSYFLRGALISAIIGDFQFILNLNLYPPDIIPSTDSNGLYRLHGGFLSPNAYGLYFALVSAFLVSTLISKFQISTLIFLLFSFFQVIATSSRSALFGLIISLIITYTKFNLKRFFIFFIKFIFICAFISIIYFSIFESADVLFDRTANDPRWLLWDNAFEYIVNNPYIFFIGLGIGDSLRSEVLFSDNLFIEQTLGGGVFLTLSFIYILRTSFNTINNLLLHNNNSQIYYYTLKMWVVIFTVSCLFSSAIAFVPVSQIFFFGIFFVGRIKCKPPIETKL